MMRMKNVLTSVDWQRIADQRTKLPLIDTLQTLMQYKLFLDKQFFTIFEEKKTIFGQTILYFLNIF